MISKALFVFFVVNLLSDFSYGQPNKKSLREDYNYIKAVDNFYKLHTKPKDWREAKLVCAEEGASLFYPEDSDEAKAVISFWKSYQNNTKPEDTWIYVGITDIITEGEFETIDGKSIYEVYNHWKLNQPDNKVDEDCLHLNQEGELNDVLCDTEYSFICKKNPLPLEQNCSCSAAHGSKSDGQRHLESIRKDYIKLGSNFYKIHTTPETWRKAKRVCALERASLFYPENRDEAFALITFWLHYQNNTDPEDTWVYVGITDIETEGKFVTIDNKSISEVYNYWKLKQPDNSNDEDCLHLNQEGELNDIGCSAEYSFICKKTPLSLERNCSCDTQKSESKKVKLDGQKDENLDEKFFRKDYTYIKSEESFYKVHTTARTFADAKRICALEGAGLFYAENVDEANAVISFWNKTQPNIPWVFVGLTDIMTEGLFETVDGRPITEVYSRWYQFQPDNQGGKENCVHMDLLRNMNDNLCDSKSYFICKKSLQSLQWNYDCNMPNLDYTFIDGTGKCYKIHTTPLNWSEAYAMCRIEYASLAVISNQMEGDYLAKLARSTPKPRLNKQYQRGIYHLGFHNRFGEGWQTVGGTPMNIDADAWFEHHQPDGNQYEECGAMFFNGRLINIDCNMKSLFICEYDIQSSYSLNKENIY